MSEAKDTLALALLLALPLAACLLAGVADKGLVVRRLAGCVNFSREAGAGVPAAAAAAGLGAGVEARLAAGAKADGLARAGVTAGVEVMPGAGKGGRAGVELAC